MNTDEVCWGLFFGNFVFTFSHRHMAVHVVYAAEYYSLCIELIKAKDQSKKIKNRARKDRQLSLASMNIPISTVIEAISWPFAAATVAISSHLAVD